MSAAAVVPFLIASQNGGLNISPTFSYTVAIVSCSLIILFGFVTIYFGGENFRKNDKFFKKDDEI